MGLIIPKSPYDESSVAPDLLLILKSSLFLKQSSHFKFLMLRNISI